MSESDVAQQSVREMHAAGHQLLQHREHAVLTMRNGEGTVHKGPDVLPGST